ncbi:MAG: hypothetical protein H0V17_30870 [Deltaproteobacteria bacterium]|nr:hypothetical protein [Deltaproteobacteria bacterium]
MADLRLKRIPLRRQRITERGIAMVASAMIAACGSAGAQPEQAQPEQASGLTAPAGWQRLEPAETAAKLAAAAPNVTVAGVQAWGEPALGCYALWLSLRGSGGDADSIARDVIEGLRSAKFTVTDQPVADGVLELGLDRAPYKGRLRARVGDGQVTGLACVANQRDPVSCETGCKSLLGAIK